MNDTQLEPLPTTGLLSFYDRLRERVAGALDKGKLGGGVADALFLAPDLFMLLVRLTFDRDVPKTSRRLIGGALLYFVTPVDLLPEALLGVGGYVDDLVLAASVVTHALGRDLEVYAARHWSGSGRLVEALRDLTESAEALVGDGLWARLRALLERRGVSVPGES